ncbi:MAG: hypothetical protein JNL74_09655, partial [Fibrobacteres bacterium]|nr:hypothetical protein [Fibrobacterota bacterium]
MHKKPAAYSNETVTWDCAIVKNHHSAIMMSAKSNGSYVKGLFISKLGLSTVGYEGKTYEFPDNQYPFPMFEYKPGRIVSGYWNRFIGFLNVKQELIAIGEESFMLRYVFSNTAPDEKRITITIQGETDSSIQEGCSLEGNEF